MTVEQDDDGDEDAQRKGVVGLGFVGLVEGVRFRKLVLVVFEFSLLFFREYAFFVFVFSNVLVGHGFGTNHGAVVDHRSSLDVGIDTRLNRKVILVLELRHLALFANSPSQMMVMSNVNHVICVDCTERCQTVTDDSKQGNQDVVDDIDNVGLTASNTDPTLKDS